MPKKYYITTPIFYVNASPHIGHAYTQIACDVISRFLKQQGRGVYFMTGTDEHGEKIEKATIQAGFKAGEEKKFVDTIIPKFKDLWVKLNIEYDSFIRTTDQAHINTVRAFLDALYKKGDIYKKEYKGWFCTPCEMFWADFQAPDGICPDCKRPAEKLNEENYFFRMSDYQAKLINLIESGELTVAPAIRRNEVTSFLKNNKLQDLCISRPKSRLSWGIELPFDTNFVAYVWVDALINYISGIGYSDDKNKFEDLWPADVHMIGKDIIRHHAIYWPIMLMALGIKPPKKVFAHGWWVVEGDKMSKSKGNVVDPNYLIDERKLPVDALRYFVLSQVQFGWDGNFSEELFIDTYNSDLANDLGNLLNRSLTMQEKYFQGVIQNDPGFIDEALGDEANAIGRCIHDAADKAAEEISGKMSLDGDGPDFKAALGRIWEIIGKCNKYIEVSAPWKHAKENNLKAISVIMNNLMQALGVVAGCLYSFMPYTAEGIWSQLGMSRKNTLKNMGYGSIKWGIVSPGTKVEKSAPLFPRQTK